MRTVIAASRERVDALLRFLQARQEDMVLVGQAASDGELFRLIRSEQPEVIVIDRRFRTRITSDWLAYLHRLSGGASIITVPDEEISL